MKKTNIISGLLLLALCGKAQSKFESIMNKMAAKVGSKSYSRADYDEAAKDSASTFLDSKEILKDPRGLSGIYYSTTPVYANTQGDKGKIVKKFLVNYEVTEKGNEKLNMFTQHAYETSNQARWVKPAYFGAEAYAPLKGVNTAHKLGYTFLNDASYDNKNYQYITHKSKQDLQGNSVPDGDYLAGWDNKDVLEVEPGILLIGDIGVNKNYTEKEIANNKKFKEVVVLYKKEKATQAAKYTREICWDKLVEFFRKYEKASNEAYNNTIEMAQPKSGIKDEPKNSDLVAAVKAKMTKENWKEELTYVYIASEWKNHFKLIGLTQANTLINRTMRVQCVFTKNGVCRVGIVEIQQDNIFNTGSVVENFGSNPLVAQGNGPVTDMGCDKASQYKK